MQKTQLIHIISVLLAFPLGCQKDSPSDEDQYLEDPGQGLVQWSCRWDSEPTPPEGMIAHGLNESMPLNDLDSCAELDPSDIDMVLIQRYKNSVVDGCNPEPFELLRGCHASRPGADTCLVTAYFFSTCELDISRE